MDDQLESYFISKLESIASLYPEGCMSWLQKARLEFYRSIDVADERINSAWNAALTDPGRVADFRAAADAWADLWVKGIGEYKKIEAKK